MPTCTFNPAGLVEKFTGTVTGLLVTPNAVMRALSLGSKSSMPELTSVLTETLLPSAPLSGCPWMTKYCDCPGCSEPYAPVTVMLPSGFVAAVQAPPVEVEQSRKLSVDGRLLCTVTAGAGPGPLLIRP